jgi:hypothetical protein
VAAYANATPLGMDTSTSDVFPQQTTDFRSSNVAFDTYNYEVSPGYFTAAETSLLAGRDVSFGDTVKTPAVVVVNQEFARRLFHSQDVVGRYFKNISGTSIQIVGVVADGKYLLLAEDPAPAAFFPISQQRTTKTSLIVRARADSSLAATIDMSATVRKVVHDLDPGVPIRSRVPGSTSLD